MWHRYKRCNRNLYHVKGKATGARKMTLLEPVSGWSEYRINLATPIADKGFDSGDVGKIGHDSSNCSLRLCGSLVDCRLLDHDDDGASMTVSRSQTTAWTNKSLLTIARFQFSCGDSVDGGKVGNEGRSGEIAFISLRRNWTGKEGIRDTGRIAPDIIMSGFSTVRTVNIITSFVVGRRSDFGFFK